MEFRDLIIDVDKTETNKETSKKTKKPTVEYEIVVQSGCDFAVRRKTAKTSRLLVMLVSQKLYYIKDEKTEAVKTLTVSDYADFKKDMKEPLKLNDVNWVDEFKKRDAYAAFNNEYILRTVNDDNFIALAKKGLIALNDSRYSCLPQKSDFEAFTSHMNIYKFLYEMYGDSSNFLRLVIGLNANYSFNGTVEPYSFTDTIRYSYYSAGDRTTDFELLNKYIDVFGLENTKNLITLLYEKCEGSFNSELRELFSIIREDNGVKFKFKDLYSYLQYAPIYNGFLDFNNFLRIYKDTLNLEYKVYEKIKEKYPKSLMLTHDQCSYQFHFKKMIIDQKNFAKAAERAKKLAWEDKEFKIIVPQVAEEITDEAVQQGNCLKTYVEKVANGACHIVFLRKKKSLEKSHISIEVNGNRVTQVEGTNHRRTFTKEEYEIMESWAKAKKLVLDFGKYRGGVTT